MSSSAFPQTTGNICVALAALIFLLPLQHLLSDYARKHLSNSEWVTPALTILIPLWLGLMVALLCATASGGFDWLRLGRPALYTLTVAATLALAAVSFVLIGLYIRPGITPSAIYSPPLYLVHFATMLVVVLSVNPRLTLGFSPQVIRLPWSIFAGLSLVAGVGFGGYWLVHTGVGTMAGIAHRLRHPGPSSQEILAKIATLDPQTDFGDLIGRANQYESREVREAATARLRSNPNFVEQLSTALKTGPIEPAVEFLYSATLSPAEQTRLAGPALTAMHRWVGHAPAANYTTKENLQRLRGWGTGMFRVLSEKFAATDIDFAPVIADFREKVDAPKR
ncbi:MAG: hypothetical protein ABIQ12_01765 [Opitutaceae bacterium]